MSDTQTGGVRASIPLPETLAFRKTDRKVTRRRGKGAGRKREDAFYEILANVESVCDQVGETFEIAGLESDKQVEKVARYIRDAAKALNEDPDKGLDFTLRVTPDHFDGAVVFTVKSNAAVNGDEDSAAEVADDDDLADEWDDDDDDDWDDDE